MQSQPQSKSWWPRAIIAYFIAAICGIATFVSWAVHQDMDLVRNDYYAEELQFQNRLDQMKRTQSLGCKAAISYDQKQDTIIVALKNATPLTLGTVQLYRPSDAALDRNVKLSPGATGSQTIDASALTEGLWKIRVRWISNTQEFFSEETIVIVRKQA